MRENVTNVFGLNLCICSISDSSHFVLAIPSKIISRQEFTQIVCIDDKFHAQRAKFWHVGIWQLGHGKGFNHGKSSVVSGASRFEINTRLSGWRRHPSTRRFSFTKNPQSSHWAPQNFRILSFLILWIQCSKFWTKEVGNKFMKLDQELPQNKAAPRQSCPWGFLALERAAQPLLPIQGGLEAFFPLLVALKDLGPILGRPV